MAPLTDTLDLQRLALRSGEGRSFELTVPVQSLMFGGQRYEHAAARLDVVLDVSRTAHSGWALRLRFRDELAGPCMRCLEPAVTAIDVEAREVEQPGQGEELASPYVTSEGVLDVAAWARDALALSLPGQIVCRDDCAGLCPVCGADLNRDPDHAHEREPDPRWAKLRELKLD